MTALDADYINRAAPPGSMRYFATLYAQPEQRTLLTALFVIETEIHTSATQVAHEVAHTRLQWWRGEIDRLVNRSAQHPATQVLQMALPETDFSVLHELLVAADMDLAQMSYNNAAELTAYLERASAGIELIAQPSNEMRTVLRGLGGLVRRAETLRDLILESRAGRVYWPLDELDAKQVTLDELRSGHPSAGVSAMVLAEAGTLRQKMTAALESITQPALRPLVVLAKLHAQLLKNIERAGGNVFTQRHELGPLQKVWTAWRAARFV
jgi:15-cis-phytoene synthase